MTTISGHNIIIQQAGAVNEAIQGTATPKPNPEQAEAQQALNSIEKGTTVQGFDEAERLKAKNERSDSKKSRERQKAKKKKEKQHQEEDPESTGRLLDTMI